MPNTRNLPARVIVAGDYPLSRDSLRRVVRRYPPQAAISETDSFNEVLRLASSVSPEPPALFALDLPLPGFTASQSIERLHRTYRRSAIVVASMLNDPRLVDEVLTAGTDGYLGESLEAGEIGMVLQTLSSGEPMVRLRGGSSAGSRQRILLDALTPRQQAVLRLTVDSLSNKGISRALSISPFAVRVHVSSLLRALEMNTRTAVTALTAKAGFQAGSTRPYPEFLREHPRMPKREVRRDFSRSLLAALKPDTADQSHP